MKNLIQRLFENAFFSDLSFNMNRELENHTKEEITYEKGDFKTTVTSYFDENGVLIGTKSKTISKSLLPSKEEERLNQLMLDKQAALDEDTSEGYIRAAELSKEIKQLEDKLKLPENK